MKTKLFYLFIFLFILLQFPPKSVFAQENSSASSAILTKAVGESVRDTRAKVLQKFLEYYGSPLAPFAQNFVDYADRYNLDWKLVAAISGVESTFGQAIPKNSYNGWGWGIYGNNVTRFASWDEGIKIVSKELREMYMDKWGARDIFEIGGMYAQSPTWAYHVLYYMNRIEDFKLSDPQSSLSITL